MKSALRKKKFSLCQSRKEKNLAATILIKYHISQERMHPSENELVSKEHERKEGMNYQYCFQH